MGRQPCRQVLRKTPYQSNSRRPGIRKTFDNACGSVRRFLDYADRYWIFRRCILEDQRRKFGNSAGVALRSKTNESCRVPLETFEYGCRKLCVVDLTIKGPKGAAQRFLTDSWPPASSDTSAPYPPTTMRCPFNHSKTTGTGAQYHDAAVGGSVSAKPSDVSIGLKCDRCKQAEFRMKAVARAFDPRARLSLVRRVHVGDFARLGQQPNRRLACNPNGLGRYPPNPNVYSLGRPTPRQANSHGHVAYARSAKSWRPHLCR